MLTFAALYLVISLTCFAWGIHQAVPLDENLVPIRVEPQH